MILCDFRVKRFKDVLIRAHGANGDLRLLMYLCTLRILMGFWVFLLFSKLGVRVSGAGANVLAYRRTGDVELTSW